jgi:hypothetical protein
MQETKGLIIILDALKMWGQSPLAPHAVPDLKAAPNQMKCGDVDGTPADITGCTYP